MINTEFNTNNYRTKTVISSRINDTKLNDYWPVGIDIGYSSVKCFSPAWVAQFPSFAVKADNVETIGDIPNSYIIYTDLDTNETWLVGEAAQDSVTIGCTNYSEEELFGRNRYFNPSFKVLLRTGLAIVGRSSSNVGMGDRSIKIQTGLPPKYMDEDSNDLCDAFVGNHHFSLKIGNSKPMEFDYTIESGDVGIVAQPFGTLYSVVFGDDNTVTANRKDFLSKNTLIFDPGFGTFDLFSIRKHRLDRNETFNDCGMKKVLQNTIARIKEEYGVSYSLPAFQNCLKKGCVTKYDQRRHKSEELPFAEILKEESEKVCMAAIAHVDSFQPQEYDYLIITGGASAAWESIIREELAGMENLTIVCGNVNDDTLPLTFANVRGYYYYLCAALKNT